MGAYQSILEIPPIILKFLALVLRQSPLSSLSQIVIVFESVIDHSDHSDINSVKMENKSSRACCDRPLEICSQETDHCRTQISRMWTNILTPVPEPHAHQTRLAISPHLDDVPPSSTFQSPLSR